MLDDEVKDIEKIIEQGLNSENNELDLREKELDDDDLIKIMESDKIKGVTAVFLEFNDIGDKGLNALLECEHMKFVTALNLFKNKVTDNGAIAIAKSFIAASALFWTAATLPRSAYIWGSSGA